MQRELDFRCGGPPCARDCGSERRHGLVAQRGVAEGRRETSPVPGLPCVFLLLVCVYETSISIRLNISLHMHAANTIHVLNSEIREAIMSTVETLYAL